ncbi:UDP-N-acetylmuramoyl-L-alanyl-D-glutamate--2,6-diaminopimelate ligase [Candidatus Dependentiae bacterium]|nr:UDP-N-acetylmuramoyl-L-alanyl-D-glutamate--2,6-diaminopimelate ligase [Candidatus Dependentiae bacterium]
MNKIILPSVYPVTSHTDFVGKGTIFVAIPGKKDDGLSYVAEALRKGASKIVVQQDAVINDNMRKRIDDFGAALQVVSNCRKALAEMAAESFGYPAKKLKIIAVTGTKGKTSTSYILYHMLLNLGKKVALSSTIEKLINKNMVKIPLTTPLPDQLHVFFDACVKANIEYVVLEVSAQALTLYRLFGLEFEAGIFTNFSHEHLEFYKNMKEYFEAKKILFSMVKQSKDMFINIDDHYGKELKKEFPGSSTFSQEDKNATIYGWPHFSDYGMQLHVKSNQKTYMFQASLLGKFNAYNLLSVLGVLSSLGINLQDIMLSMMTLKKIPGRMEQYNLMNGARCFIDYAHNPSSFEAVLSTLRTMTPHLIAVFGAGGNRDKQKRPMMGSIAQKYCDVIILTADNPRDEDPAVIAQEIAAGFVEKNSCQIYKELNRTKAIEFSYELSNTKTIIAILGKGPDEYQIVGDLTFPFKERSIIKKYLQEAM